MMSSDQLAANSGSDTYLWSVCLCASANACARVLASGSICLLRMFWVCFFALDCVCACMCVCVCACETSGFKLSAGCELFGCFFALVCVRVYVPTFAYVHVHGVKFDELSANSRNTSLLWSVCERVRGVRIDQLCMTCEYRHTFLAYPFAESTVLPNCKITGWRRRQSFRFSTSCGQ